MNACGALKLKYVEEEENILVLRALLDVNLAKFLSQDIPLFKGITADLFPGVVLPSGDYEALMNSILVNAQKLNYQPVPSFIEKIFQIYEMMLVRHGFMVVGEAFSGKSAALKVLQNAMTQLAIDGDTSVSKVITQVINPKSITMGQLYGQFDPVSHGTYSL